MPEKTAQKPQEVTAPDVPTAPAPSNKNYFNQGTEDAIVRFQRATDLTERNAIFVADIKPAFDKLAENIINVYGFHAIGEVPALKTDCVSMLFENLYKFNSERGHKAFSYFNVIAKNWFIQKTKVHKKRSGTDIHINKELMGLLERTNDNLMVMAREDEALELEFFELLKTDMRGWNTKFCKPQERIVLDAVRLLLENPDMPTIYNKKGIYLYIREITDLNTKQIVVNLTKLRKRYATFKKRYLAGKI